jgi:integrase
MQVADPHTGIMIMKSIGTYVTREEAEAVRAEMLKKPASPYTASTLRDMYNLFKESREYKKRAASTRELYDLSWKYLQPLWDFKISALYAQDFQIILDKMVEDGLSRSMLEKEQSLISKLYQTAIGWRVVEANLASVLTIEGKETEEREIFNDDQILRILRQLDDPTGEMVIALMACGARLFELIQFKHEDYHRTADGAYVIGGCKTEKGRNRVMPILAFGIPAFDRAYENSVAGQPLFSNRHGNKWNENNWRNRRFYPFLEALGIQENPYDDNGKRKPEFAGRLATYTPYTTRHTYASLCDRAGVDKELLKRAVGHTEPSKTLDEIYLHPSIKQMLTEFRKADLLVEEVRTKEEATA